MKRHYRSDLLLVTGASIFALVLFLLFDFSFSRRLVYGNWWLDDQSGPMEQVDSSWYQLKRNYVGFDRWDYRLFPVRTDSYGFRVDDQEAPLPHQADVIFLGDSFTYGINGRWRDTFVGMVQSKGYRVVNAGVTSYAPTVYIYQYLRAAKAGRLAAGHAVVVGLDMSDVADEAHRWTDGDAHPAEAIRDHPAATQRLHVFLRERLLFSQMIYAYLRHLRSGTTRDAEGEAQADAVVNSAFTWKDMERSPAYTPLGVSGGLARVDMKLAQLASTVRENHGRLFLLIYPWPAQLNHPNNFYDWESHAIVLCRTLTCDGVINTFPAFRSIKRTDPHWYPRNYLVGDVHFNTSGNSVVAGEILRELAKGEIGKNN